jgi:hypothetical protein
MAKKSFVWAVIATALVLSPAAMLAQEDMMHVPVTVTFFPPLSTSGFYAYKVSTNFSLNIIGGYVGAVKGCEIGSVFNIDVRGMEGCQLGGVLNIVAGDARGFQAASVLNIVAGNLEVCQSAGVGNFVAGTASGAQLASVFNFTAGQVAGLQLSGVANVAVGDVAGVQIASSVNVAAGDCPVQLGVTNVAIGENHAQIGVANFAGNAKALQLGVVNVAGRNDGVPIGVVSVAGNSRFQANVWADEVSLLNVALKIRNGRIYNVYTMGFNPIAEEAPLGKFGVGLGGHMPFDPFFVDIGAVHYNVYEGIRFWEQEGYSGLTTVHFTGGWQVLPILAITAGPTLNVWHSSVWNGEYIRNFGLLLGDYDGVDTYTDIWLGFSLGIELF